MLCRGVTTNSAHNGGGANAGEYGDGDRDDGRCSDSGGPVNRLHSSNEQRKDSSILIGRAEGWPCLGNNINNNNNTNNTNTNITTTTTTTNTNHNYNHNNDVENTNSNKV